MKRLIGNRLDRHRPELFVGQAKGACWQRRRRCRWRVGAEQVQRATEYNEQRGEHPAGQNDGEAMLCSPRP
jgi:hypothetical protein